jgi:curved DNA-binding protein CbpA
MKDYYKSLELEFGADIPTVKKSYRRLALRYHPDKNKAADASQKFIEITEAYEVLNNEAKKLEYDNFYSKFFRSQNNSTETNEKTSSEKTKEWTTYGKKKAEEYASMKYDDFADRIIDELKLGISYTPNIIFILICGIGVVSSFYIMAEVSGIFGLIMLAMYGAACYFLYERARKDYIAERRHKILNKYK